MTVDAVAVSRAIIRVEIIVRQTNRVDVVREFKGFMNFKKNHIVQKSPWQVIGVQSYALNIAALRMVAGPNL